MNRFNIDVGTERGFRLFAVLKATGAAILLSIALMALFALAVTHSPISDGILPKAVLAITILSLLLAGFLAAGHSGSRGWFAGMIAGIVYAATVSVLGILVFGSVSFGGVLGRFFFTCALTGAVGGIIGINSGKK